MGVRVWRGRGIELSAMESCDLGVELEGFVHALHNLLHHHHLPPPLTITTTTTLHHHHLSPSPPHFTATTSHHHHHHHHLSPSPPQCLSPSSPWPRSSTTRAKSVGWKYPPDELSSTTPWPTLVTHHSLVPNALPSSLALTSSRGAKLGEGGGGGGRRRSWVLRVKGGFVS